MFINHLSAAETGTTHTHDSLCSVLDSSTALLAWFSLVKGLHMNFVLTECIGINTQDFKWVPYQ